MAALTNAERAARHRTRRGAAGRRKNKIRMRHARDLVRNVLDLGASSKPSSRTYISRAAEAAIRGGHVDDYRAEAIVLALETLPPVKSEAEAGAWLKATADNLAKADARTQSHIDRSANALREYSRLAGDTDTWDDDDDPRLRPGVPGTVSDSTGSSTFYVLACDPPLELWIRCGGLGDGSNVQRVTGLTVRKVRGLRALRKKSLR